MQWWDGAHNENRAILSNYARAQPWTPRTEYPARAGLLSAVFVAVGGVLVLAACSLRGRARRYPGFATQNQLLPTNLSAFFPSHLPTVARESDEQQGPRTWP